MAAISAPGNEDAALAAQWHERQTKRIRHTGDAKTDVGVTKRDCARDVSVPGYCMSVARNALRGNAGATKLCVEQRTRTRSNRPIGKPYAAAPEIARAAQFFRIAPSNDPTFLYRREFVDVDRVIANAMREALHFVARSVNERDVNAPLPKVCKRFAIAGGEPHGVAVEGFDVRCKEAECGFASGDENHRINSLRGHKRVKWVESAIYLSAGYHRSRRTAPRDSWACILMGRRRCEEFLDPGVQCASEGDGQANAGLSPSGFDCSDSLSADAGGIG